MADTAGDGRLLRPVSARLRADRVRAAAAEAEDGLLILTAACEMRLKNAILIGSIRDGVDFSVDRYVDMAASVLLELADQADASSQRFATAREAARRTRGRGVHVHDYRRVDVRNLTHKEAVSLAVAEELRRRSEDPVILRALVVRARASAWEEMSSVLQQRLGSLHSFEHADPAAGRAAGISALRQDIDDAVRAHTHPKRASGQRIEDA